MPARQPLPSGTTPERDAAGGTRSSLPRRLLWFAGLWLASIALLGVIAYGIRFWLGLG